MDYYHRPYGNNPCIELIENREHRPHTDLYFQFVEQLLTVLTSATPECPHFPCRRTRSSRDTLRDIKMPSPAQTSTRTTNSWVNFCRAQTKKLYTFTHDMQMCLWHFVLTTVCTVWLLRNITRYCSRVALEAHSAFYYLCNLEYVDWWYNYVIDHLWLQ